LTAVPILIKTRDGEEEFEGYYVIYVTHDVSLVSPGSVQDRSMGTRHRFTQWVRPETPS
jgi:hypothetical protein